ncbi:MAG: BlaI/MecI/CopY family transcriptional regulator [Oscillospiraceae bacterium]|nr:BlaI/MecI/CopY family transcriptional regulator [Oscillospiraceae bacterium]
MQKYRLSESEYRFVKIIWDNQPMPSALLVEKSLEILDWKKSTTYTMLKRLCEKGVLKNENSTVTTLVSRSEVEKYQSSHIVNETFGGSLPNFIAAFMQDKKLTKEEAEKLKQLIDSYKE